MKKLLGTVIASLLVVAASTSTFAQSANDSFRNQANLQDNSSKAAALVFGVEGWYMDSDADVDIKSYYGGDVFIGAHFNPESSVSFRLAGSVGYYETKMEESGVGFRFTRSGVSRYRYTSEVTQEEIMVMFQPSVIFGKDIYFAVTPMIGYTSLSSDSFDDDYTGIAYGIKAGVGFNFGETVFLEVSGKYLGFQYDIDGEWESGDDAYGAGLTLGFKF